ncbi:hypothetical protein HDU76_002850 [Blyttiomyces sp. JEL0837]|nr:hypothetical protein HDU76_002850 [Blyttiomyces sp. JEL0837]
MASHNQNSIGFTSPMDKNALHPEQQQAQSPGSASNVLQSHAASYNHNYNGITAPMNQNTVNTSSIQTNLIPTGSYYTPSQPTSRPPPVTTPSSNIGTSKPRSRRPVGDSIYGYSQHADRNFMSMGDVPQFKNNNVLRAANVSPTSAAAAGYSCDYQYGVGYGNDGQLISGAASQQPSYGYGGGGNSYVNVAGSGYGGSVGSQGSNGGGGFGFAGYGKFLCDLVQGEPSYREV